MKNPNEMSRKYYVFNKLNDSRLKKILDKFGKYSDASVELLVKDACYSLIMSIRMAQKFHDALEQWFRDNDLGMTEVD
jgi:hypothetical protein